MGLKECAKEFKEAAKIFLSFFYFWYFPSLLKLLESWRQEFKPACQRFLEKVATSIEIFLKYYISSNCKYSSKKTKKMIKNHLQKPYKNSKIPTKESFALVKIC